MPFGCARWARKYYARYHEVVDRAGDDSQMRRRSRLVVKEYKDWRGLLYRISSD